MNMEHEGVVLGRDRKASQARFNHLSKRLSKTAIVADMMSSLLDHKRQGNPVIAM